MRHQNFFTIYCAPPGAGDAEDSTTKQIAYTFSHRYDKKFLVLDVPYCFERLYNKQTVLEVSISSTIQPLRLLYINNVVTHSIGFILINSWRYVKYGGDDKLA